MANDTATDYTNFEYDSNDYYSSSDFTAPQGTLSYDKFDPVKYLQANADVAAEAGWNKNKSSAYSHYVGRFPDNNQIELPDYSTRAGAYEMSAEDLANLSGQQNLDAALESLSGYLDPETGKIKTGLTGGTYGEDFDLDALKSGSITDIQAALDTFKERDVARQTGFLGAFDDADSYDTYKAGVGSKSSYVDAYGNVTPIGTYADLVDNPALPQGTELSLNRLEASGNEFLDSDSYKLTPTALNVTAAQGVLAQASNADKTDAQSFEAKEVFEAAAKQQVDAARQEGLSDYVEAQTGAVDVSSTVQGQLAKLMTQFEGGSIPAWAAGAVRGAEQKLASRGMGASSMAGSAIVQAAMEASTPIAAADAETYRRMNELNLNNRQQAEVLNAQMVLQMDMTNLTNEQQARITNNNTKVSALFNDQAAVNSAKQFNAQSEQQNDQFFAGLFQDTAKFNANQRNSMEQFNAGQTNAVSQFNAELQNSRDQFNTKNSILIDQANVTYRREINTANTAMANAELEYNTTNLFNISQNAQNQLLQEYRDGAAYARLNALNESEYQYNLALQSFITDNNLDTASEIAQGSLVGGVLASAASAVFSSFL